MADRKTLGILGFMLGTVTAVVMLVAGAVVHAHVVGQLTLDGSDDRVAVMSVPADKQ